MPRYVMRQKWLAIGDDAWIEDENGERVFRVDGKATSHPARTRY